MFWAGHRNRGSWRLAVVGVLLILGQAGATELLMANLPQTAGGRFHVLKEWNGEAVLDRDTQLIWERSPSQGETRWGDAAVRCALKSIGGRRGWRLPSFFELMTLIDPSVQRTSSGPALPPEHPFLGIHASPYWTVTSKSDDPSHAYAVDFYRGDVASQEKARLRPYWCVRGGSAESQKIGPSISHHSDLL